MKYKRLIAFFAIALSFLLQSSFNKQAKLEQSDEIQNGMIANKKGLVFDKKMIVPTATQQTIEF